MTETTVTVNEITLNPPTSIEIEVNPVSPIEIEVNPATIIEVEINPIGQSLVVETNSVIYLEAGDNLEAYSPIVCINNKAYLADASNIEHAYRLVGIALRSNLIGENIKIQTSGDITNPAWNFQLDRPIFLGRFGELNQIPDGVFLQELGVAVTSSRIILNIKETALL